MNVPTLAVSPLAHGWGVFISSPSMGMVPARLLSPLVMAITASRWRRQHPATDSRTSDGRRLEWRKIMSKCNESLKLGPTTQVRELRDDELGVVSGGKVEANLQQKTEIRQVQALATNQW